MSKYSVWIKDGDTLDQTMVLGTHQPQYTNGKRDSEEDIKLYEFVADTWEEAMAIYHLRQGWEPYKPQGKAKPCPMCGSNYYPDGSSECWKCI